MNNDTLTRVLAIYEGSDGDATKALYDRLNRLGPNGQLAVDVFRAQKASERAKKYRGGRGGTSYRAMAYEKKNWSLERLAQGLTRHAASLGIAWGWAYDSRAPNFEHLLYVELPTGQISWHGQQRHIGPDYTKPWDEARGAAPGRICTWVASILETEPAL